ncbi:hypothetical protein BPAE_0206g00070 [Botrytis paeoniae]|uniref:Berberine/berberine-like domain-containing protein n=1 Tax=Botrytis paeoniae TaxID=278948 RepID=A0A4Z1FG96_9HELO|nr:hypothetical protein BPAE_0206g00070 [Botrytis paeoniae]
MSLHDRNSRNTFTNQLNSSQRHTFSRWKPCGLQCCSSRMARFSLLIQAQVNAFQDQFKVLTPGGGLYMNEATFDNLTWKEDYYGANYDRLLEAKLSYDPNFVLYAHTSVGSDLITVASDGRLCKD